MPANILEKMKNNYVKQQPDEMPLLDYLELCKTDPMAYASPAERLLAAIGEPEIIDTSADPRLSRIFQNRKITRYPTFDEFYGAEEPIMQIVSFLRHAAQGLEERKQVLYLLGPVGGGKSSLADRLKSLMETKPFYALKTPKGISPVFESPLGLFHGENKMMEEEFGIDPRYMRHAMSPWAAKRLKEFEGDLTKFSVVKLYPSIVNQIAISSTEPGDENNQDISALVGKVDVRKMEDFAQDDPDAYSYSGGLCNSNQGLMEFIEMFKAPIKVLHPLLTATQDGRFQGTEAIGAIPFNGIVLAHSNESEWKAFRNNPTNEAFIDRVNIIKVPYCLQVTEEKQIYEKLVRNSALKKAPCAPQTLDIMAQWSVLTRLKDHENSSIYSKMLVLDGKNLKDTDPKAKSYKEYKEKGGLDEGMDGMSTRFAYKTLSQVFNYNAAHGGEIAANPLHLFYVLEQAVQKQQLPAEKEAKYLGFIKDFLKPKYVDFIKKEIQNAYMESYADYGQNIFDKYVLHADFWIQDQDYRDPDTGHTMDRAALGAELEKIEKPAGISNPKDFRNEVVNFVLRQRALNNGKNPEWTAYEKLRAVIEKSMFSDKEKILPVLSFDSKLNSDDKKKQDNYVDRMVKKGYTPSQVRLLSEWVHKLP